MPTDGKRKYDPVITHMVWPVTAEAMSEQRNSAAFPTSSEARSR